MFFIESVGADAHALREFEVAEVVIEHVRPGEGVFCARVVGGGAVHGLADEDDMLSCAAGAGSLHQGCTAHGAELRHADVIFMRLELGLLGNMVEALDEGEAQDGKRCFAECRGEAHTGRREQPPKPGEHEGLCNEGPRCLPAEHEGAECIGREAQQYQQERNGHALAPHGGASEPAEENNERDKGREAYPLAGIAHHERLQEQAAFFRRGGLQELRPAREAALVTLHIGELSLGDKGQVNGGGLDEQPKGSSSHAGEDE